MTECQNATYKFYCLQIISQEILRHNYKLVNNIQFIMTDKSQYDMDESTFDPDMYLERVLKVISNKCPRPSFIHFHLVGLHSEAGDGHGGDHREGHANTTQ